MSRNRWGVDEDWRRWRARWTVLSLPIAVMALMWGSTTLLSISLLPGLLGGVAQIVVLTNLEAAVSDTYILRAFATTTLFSGLIALSVATVGSIAPSAAALSLVLLALTSPPCALLRSTHPHARRLGSADQVMAPTPSTAESEKNARSVGEQIILVQLRQSYRDELEARDAAPALRAWLSAGARAAGGPSRYLVRGPHRPEAT